MTTSPNRLYEAIESRHKSSYMFEQTLWNCSDEIVAALRAAQHIRSSILDRLLHGDEIHRAWLKSEIDFIFAPQDRALEALAAKVNA